MPSIRDVAKAAGVSSATVSRSLSGSGGVTAETRAHVLHVAQRLGYERRTVPRPSDSMVGLALGLVVPDLLNPFYASLVKGIERRARSSGLFCVVADTAEDVLQERRLLEQFVDVLDGVVVASPRGADTLLQMLAERAKIVLVNREVDGVPSVVSDLFDGTRQLLQHVVALGHQRVGYAGGPPSSWSDRVRREALRDLPDTYGTGKVTIVDLGSFRPSHGGGVAAADAAVAASVSAVIAFNDQLAMGILSRLSDRGIAVPADMSITGFDDIPMARLLAPALTSTAVPAVWIGERAVEMLMTEGELAACERVKVPVELMVRGSTALYRSGTASGNEAVGL